MTPGPGRPHLSVVIPASDEEGRLSQSLPRVEAYLRQGAVEAEVLVVDDGSADGTGRVARELLGGRRGRVIRVAERRGRGHAIRSGALQAAGRWVLITDAAPSVPITEHAVLAAAARDRDLDVVVGSRALPGARVGPAEPLLRRLGALLEGSLARRVAGLTLLDLSGTFLLLDRGRTRPLFERMVVDGAAAAVELLFLCVRFGLRVEEVPVARSGGEAGTRHAVEALRLPLDLARIRWRFRRGEYNPVAAAEGEGAEREAE